MFEDKSYLFKTFDFNTPILIKEVRDVENKFNIKFPNDYIEFMLKTNGGNGAIGEDSFLSLWKMNDLVELNEEYAIEEFAPGLIIIGSNGGGSAYGYDFRNENPKLVEVDFIGMEIDDPFYCYNSFFEFIEYLYNYKYE